MNFNKVLIIGNLTRDPEMTYLPSGSPVANFGLAINNDYTDKGGKKHANTVFVDIAAFGKTAEVAVQYLSKGKPVLIDGKLKYSSWENKDGHKQNKLSVVADKIVFLGEGKENS